MTLRYFKYFFINMMLCDNSNLNKNFWIIIESSAKRLFGILRIVMDTLHFSVSILIKMKNKCW